MIDLFTMHHLPLQEFNYEVIKEQPALTLPELFSSIGGTLGLCCGLSLLRCPIVSV